MTRLAAAVFADKGEGLEARSVDEFSGCAPGCLGNALLDPLFVIGVVGVGRLTLIGDGGIAQARDPGIVAAPLLLEGHQNGVDTVAAGVEVVEVVGVDDLVVFEVAGADAVHGADEPLDWDQYVDGVVTRTNAGFDSSSCLSLLQLRGSQFGDEVGACSLEAAGAVGVVDGPGLGVDAGIDGANGNAGESGGRPLVLHPVVPVGDDETAFGRGVEAVAERVFPPSLVERELDIIATFDYAAPAAIGADAHGGSSARFMPGGVVDRVGAPRESVCTNSSQARECQSLDRRNEWPLSVRMTPQLDQFEGDDVDPADVDEGRRTEERMRRVVERRPCLRRFRLTGRGA